MWTGGGVIWDVIRDGVGFHEGIMLLWRRFKACNAREPIQSQALLLSNKKRLGLSFAASSFVKLTCDSFYLNLNLDRRQFN